MEVCNAQSITVIPPCFESTHMNNSDLFHLYETLQHAMQMLNHELDKRNIHWRTYADNGMRIKAVVRYREISGGSLSDAKASVDAYCAQRK